MATTNDRRSRVIEVFNNSDGTWSAKFIKHYHARCLEFCGWGDDPESALRSLGDQVCEYGMRYDAEMN